MEDTTPPPDPAPQPPGNDPTAYTQQVQHNPVSARVVDRVARGVMSTGLIVLDTPSEFILDFVQGMVRPYQFVARVVVPPVMMQKLLAVVEDNLNKYTQSFGVPPQLPKPPARRPSIAEIYENFKLPEELLNGYYANNVRVGHSPAEFFIDFMTDFYPTAAVSARVFMSPPHIPRLVETLRVSAERKRQPPASPEGPTPGV
jgi:hypothetical protein